MQRHFVPALLIAFSLPFTSCRSLFPNHDLVGSIVASSPNVEQRFEQSMDYNRQHNCEVRHIAAANEDYRVYLISDTHTDTTSCNLSAFVSNYKHDDRCPFALHMGDLINGENHYAYFDSVTHIIPHGCSDKPLYTTVGNHDLYFGQWDQYRHYYGTSTYIIEVHTPNATDVFICLDSGSETLGSAQTRWLQQTLEHYDREDYRHRIVFTHTHLLLHDYYNQINSTFPIEETYELLHLMQQYHVELVLMGHNHYREVSSYGGTTYLVMDSGQDKMSNPCYATIDMEQLSYTFHPFKTEKGGQE